MLVSLSRRLLKPTNHSVSWSTKSFNSWALAIRNASSPQKALYLYSKMHQLSLPFDSFSLHFTIKACAQLQSRIIIQHFHAHIIKVGFCCHVYVATSMLQAYVVTSFESAGLLFDEIPERNTVTWNTMISGYSRTGDVERARAVFDEMPLRDVVSWSAMIAAYVNSGNPDRGLALFRDMMACETLKPDQVTVGSVLSGCAHMGSLGVLVGKSVHGFITKNGWELNVELGTVLVDMYTKCGYMKNASQVFELMPERNVVTWTALICGSAQNGFSKEALTLFEMMRTAGVRPNELTLTGILSACMHKGLVEEGRKYFKMIEECGLEPRIQHYGCMVDMLGKAGLLEEAYEVIRTMRWEPNAVVWGSFLSACREHKHFEMAEKVIDQVLRIVKPENDGGVYSLISDLYVLGEKWDEAERLRKLMAEENVRKARGSSFIRSR
ncbi:hypothetical protein F2P56_008943 [Juglans regia]|uniref:Pentatricopeptide repeat-containing protein At5g66520-like n=2 Tax=Juglans regia TaxID=51240 RepID=A0A2I4FQT9_JUGRE|nr:pentatricopeptide repeat-containing protein At5g66520-like [Juglans regia]KAF5472206.1 hypothetical protein F2P56_008943 [Juglans regia]